MISIVRNTAEEILSYALGYGSEDYIEKNVQSEPESKKPKKEKPKKIVTKKLKKTGLGKKFDLGLEKVAKKAQEINAPVKKAAKKNTPSIKKKGRNITGKKGKVGIKRKGRLPSKKIVNKLGNVQTVYYRPDKKSKSKYIDPTKLSTPELMKDYGESFKRMLFRDHDSNSRHGWTREKGQENQSWGSEMTSKLDKLADDYGFKLEKFDQQQESFVNERHGDLDGFLHDAQKIYGELYKMDKKHPFQFISSIFSPTKDKIGYANVGKNDKKQLAEFGIKHMVENAEAGRLKEKAMKKKSLVDNVADNKVRKAGTKMKGVATTGNVSRKPVSAPSGANAKDNRAAKQKVATAPNAPKTSGGTKTGANEDDKQHQSQLVGNQKVKKNVSQWRKLFG